MYAITSERVPDYVYFRGSLEVVYHFDVGAPGFPECFDDSGNDRIDVRACLAKPGNDAWRAFTARTRHPDVDENMLAPLRAQVAELELRAAELHRNAEAERTRIRRMLATTLDRLFEAREAVDVEEVCKATGLTAAELTEYSTGGSFLHLSNQDRILEYEFRSKWFYVRSALFSELFRRGCGLAKYSVSCGGADKCWELAVAAVRSAEAQLSDAHHSVVNSTIS